jgi:hypothetical protein
MSILLPSGWSFIEDNNGININYSNREVRAKHLSEFQEAAHVYSPEFDPSLFFWIISDCIAPMNDMSMELFEFYNGDCQFSINADNIVFFSPQNGSFSAFRIFEGNIGVVVNNIEKLHIIVNSGLIKTDIELCFDHTDAKLSGNIMSIEINMNYIIIPPSHRFGSGVLITKISGDTIDYSSAIVVGQDEVQYTRKLFRLDRSGNFLRLTCEDLPYPQWMNNIVNEYSLVHSPDNNLSELWTELKVEPIYKGIYVFVSVDKRIFLDFGGVWIAVDKRQIEGDRKIPIKYVDEYNMFKSLYN